MSAKHISRKISMNTGVKGRHQFQPLVEARHARRMVTWLSGACLLLSASFANADWDITTVDHLSASSDTSLAFGPDKQPAISYSSIFGGLGYTHYDGTQWLSTWVDNQKWAGGFNSLAFDPDGQPAISYCGDTKNGERLNLARFDGAVWDIAVVFYEWDADSDFDNSLAFGPDGLPAISYYDYDTGNQMFAGGFDGFQWRHTEVQDWHLGNVNSLAFAPDGLPAISYYVGEDWQYGPPRLSFARFDGKQWNIIAVDAHGDVGDYNSLAFGPDGQPAISYYDTSNGDLKFARFDGKQWNITAVDSQGDVGQYTALAFGPDGQPAISYYDASNGDLKFARLTTCGQWILTAVDTQGDVGTDTSLAFGPDGRPAISYHDESKMSLKFARLVTDKRSEQNAPQVVSDGAGGAIYIWEQQSTAGDWNIYAQRMDITGRPLWGSGYPIAICTASGDQRYPQVVAYDDNNGQLNGEPGSKGAIIIWTDFRSKAKGLQFQMYGLENSDIYVQKINSSGCLQWQPDGVIVCAADAKDYNPQVIAPAWDGSVVIAWLEKYGMYAIPLCQPENDFDPQNSTTWGSGTPLPGCGATKYRVLANRLDRNGQVLMAPNGVSCTSLGGIKDDVHLVTDENRGAILTWVQEIPKNSRNYDIYAQRIENTGFLRWGGLGIPVCTAAGLQLHPRIAKDGMGGALMTWQDNRSGTGDIYAHRIDANGNIVANWPVNGLAVCTAPGYQVLPEIAGNSLGAATIVWQDFRNNKDFNIYAQRVNPTGTIKWGLTGNPVTTAVGAQLNPQITGDGANGVYITWMDVRYGRSDIYAQWLDSNGGAYWGENGDYPPNTPGIKEYNGAAVCRADGNQIDPQAFWSPWGSYYVVWTDRRRGDLLDADIYTQQVDFHGKVKWGTSATADKNGKLIAQ